MKWHLRVYNSIFWNRDFRKLIRILINKIFVLMIFFLKMELQVKEYEMYSLYLKKKYSSRLKLITKLFQKSPHDIIVFTNWIFTYFNISVYNFNVNKYGIRKILRQKMELLWTKHSLYSVSRLLLQEDYQNIYVLWKTILFSQNFGLSYCSIMVSCCNINWGYHLFLV